MQTILVAADDSARSDPALGRAVALAAALGARLVAVTALEDRDGSPSPETLAAAQAGLLARIASWPNAVALDYRAEALLGAPAEAVPAALAASGAGLLVLGLHRPRPLDILRETTMERILRAAAVPVLLARLPPERAYARVLALTAFAPACAAALACARTLAPGAELQILHALHVPLSDRLAPGRAEAEAEARAAAWAATLPPGCPPPLVVAGGVAELLAVAVEDFAPDLIAVGAATDRHGERLGHVVRDLIREPPADVLVARG